MANFLNADLIVKELSARVQTAWTLTDGDVFDYPPLEVPSPTHVVIVAQGATKGQGGAQCKSFVQTFAILAQFPYPSDMTATEFRTSKANALLTQIYKARNFLDGVTPLGSLYGVEDIAFDDIGEPHARTLELRMSFQIETLNIQVPV
jgi:hypothetical protein